MSTSPCSTDGSYTGDPKERNTDLITLRTNIECRLFQEEGYIPVAFPPCSDVLLSQITENGTTSLKDDIIDIFKEYFSYGEHIILDDSKLPKSGDLLDCTKKSFKRTTSYDQKFPPPGCLPSSCLRLEGIRNFSSETLNDPTKNIVRIRKLFIGDIVWLFYFERMGIFKILGVILDDFATKGKFPIANDNLMAIILEAMVRQTKMGLSSAVRDRDSSYRRCLGWTSDAGRKLESGAVINTGFNNLFHKFIQVALEYYKEKRLATAIQATNIPGKPSVATLITIGDTITVLKKAFKPFDYGRNHFNTLNGIVWVIAALDIIKRIRTTLGIPDQYNDPSQYIPAAYDLLLMGRPITPSETNRYTIHKECAKDARDILLDMQVLRVDKSEFAKPNGELEIWLDLVEDRIEGYRTDYRTLTGVDLGAPGTPKIEQQV